MSNMEEVGRCMTYRGYTPGSEVYRFRIGRKATSTSAVASRISMVLIDIRLSDAEMRQLLEFLAVLYRAFEQPCEIFNSHWGWGKSPSEDGLDPRNWPDLLLTQKRYQPLEYKIKPLSRFERVYTWVSGFSRVSTELSYEKMNECVAKLRAWILNTSRRIRTWGDIDIREVGPEDTR